MVRARSSDGFRVQRFGFMAQGVVFRVRSQLSIHQISSIIEVLSAGNGEEENKKNGTRS